MSWRSCDRADKGRFLRLAEWQGKAGLVSDMVTLMRNTRCCSFVDVTRRDGAGLTKCETLATCLGVIAAAGGSVFSGAMASIRVRQSGTRTVALLPPPDCQLPTTAIIPPISEDEIDARPCQRVGSVPTEIQKYKMKTRSEARLRGLASHYKYAIGS